MRERSTEILTPMHLATLDMMFPWGLNFLYIPLPMTNTTGEGRRRHVSKVFDRTVCDPEHIFLFEHTGMTQRVGLPPSLPGSTVLLTLIITGASEKYYTVFSYANIET